MTLILLDKNLLFKNLNFAPRNVEQKKDTRNIVLINQAKKEDKIAQLTNNSSVKNKEQKLKRFKEKNGILHFNYIVLYKIRHFLVCLLQCLYLPLASTIRYIYLYIYISLFFKS